jgi:hypothetical protein
MFVGWCEILNPSFITDITVGQIYHHKCILWTWKRQEIPVVFNS